MESQLSYKATSDLGGAVYNSSDSGEPNKKIEGYIYLKRKQDWVKRYAIVQNCIFSYKK
jgi:hypothetical protein